MDKKEYELFAQTYKRVEAICTEIMNKIACSPDEEDDNKDWKNYIIDCEEPTFDRLVVDENNNVEFRWFNEDVDYSEDIVIVPKEVFINEDIDEWCKNALAEHRKKIEEQEKERQAEKEAEERALYERLKKKYG